MNRLRSAPSRALAASVDIPGFLRPHALLGAFLAVLLAGLGARSAGADCPGQGSCLDKHKTIGCDDEACCEIVCAVNPLCCLLSWDADCVLTAHQTCVDLCGAMAAGSCFVPSLTAGCDDKECCAAVCVIDPFCCETRWDAACAVMAQLNCTPPSGADCGDFDAGSCFQPHPNPACSDLLCCETVCEINPSCCTIVWDVICASVAQMVCVTNCVTTCPPGSVNEIEPCGQNQNDPCYNPSQNPTLQTIPCNGVACGRIRVTTSPLQRDIDVWRVVVTDDDGDGFASVQLSFSAAFSGFACLLPAQGCQPFASALTHVNTQLCVEQLSEPICVPPGEYHVVVAPGTWPTLGNQTVTCGLNDTYRIRVFCADAGCAPPCGSEGSCYEAHKTPGCADAECCEMICAKDPICCDVQWDALCAEEAIVLCAEAPENDDCATATEILAGAVDFETFGATDGPPDAACVGKSALKDLWFRYQPTTDSLIMVSTCGARLTFDSAITVYRGTCDALELIECNDDGGGSCLPKFASEIFVNMECGETYFIRIGGGAGYGTLTVTSFAGSDCPASCVGDLNEDGTVDGADLGILLGAWGQSAGGPADLNGDGVVNGADLGILLGAWGACGG